MPPRMTCSILSLPLLLSLSVAGCTLSDPSPTLRTVRVKAVVDPELQKKDPRWSEGVRGLVEAASDFFEREFGIRFVTRAVHPWPLAESTPLTSVLLTGLKKRVPLNDQDGSYDLVIAFTGQQIDRSRGRARVDRIGNCEDGLGNYVVSFVSRPFRYAGPLAKPELDVLALVHELGHIFGAEHTQDIYSIMHEPFGRRDDFDQKNRAIILRNKFCPFATGGH